MKNLIVFASIIDIQESIYAFYDSFYLRYYDHEKQGAILYLIGLHFTLHARDKFCSGGGGLKSLARIFFSIACT